jgi:hypothetical protein
LVLGKASDLPSGARCGGPVPSMECVPPHREGVDIHVGRRDLLSSLCKGGNEVGVLEWASTLPSHEGVI